MARNGLPNIIRDNTLKQGLTSLKLLAFPFFLSASYVSSFSMLQITHPILKTFPPFLDTSKVLHFESLQMFLPSTFNILNPNHPTLLLIPIFPLHLYISPPPNLIIHLSINQRSRQLRRQFIPADDEGRIGFEEAIDVFEAAIGGFRIEEVGYGDEGEADYGLGGVSLGGFGMEGMEREGMGWNGKGTQTIQNL